MVRFVPRIMFKPTEEALSVISLKIMKKLLFIAILIIFVSCKKESVNPVSDLVEFGLSSKINDPSPGGYVVADSTRFCLYKVEGKDTVLIDKKYSNNQGKTSVFIPKYVNYLVKATSRTYKFTYNSQPHYYEYYFGIIATDTYLNRASTKNDFNSGAQFTGYGCTNYYIQDPTE